MQPDTRYARSGDVQVAYQVTGEGPVDLVMAPGTASHLDLDWEWPEKADFLKRLGSFCRLILWVPKTSFVDLTWAHIGSGRPR